MLRLSVRKGLRFLPMKIFLLEVANLYFARISVVFGQSNSRTVDWKLKGTSPDIVKLMLCRSRIRGEIPLDFNHSTLIALLEALYKFQLSDDLLRVCQEQCTEIINESNVKNVLLSAKLHVATFLFDACFEYVCQHFFRYHWKGYNVCLGCCHGRRTALTRHCRGGSSVI